MKSILNFSSLVNTRDMVSFQQIPICKLQTNSGERFRATWPSCLYMYRFIISKSTFLEISSSNTFRVSNSLDPDQARHFVGPGLGPNCLQRLSADDTSL